MFDWNKTTIMGIKYDVKLQKKSNIYNRFVDKMILHFLFVENRMLYYVNKSFIVVI